MLKRKCDCLSDIFPLYRWHLVQEMMAKLKWLTDSIVCNIVEGWNEKIVITSGQWSWSSLIRATTSAFDLSEVYHERYERNVITKIWCVLHFIVASKVTIYTNLNSIPEEELVSASSSKLASYCRVEGTSGPLTSALLLSPAVGIWI